MKGFILIVIIAAAYSATAVPLVQNDPDFVYQRFIQFPDGDGVMHEVDLEEEPDLTFVNRVARNGNHNLYLLFTRRNPTSAQTLVMNNAQSIWNSYFNPHLPTVVIAHGWKDSQTSSINGAIRDAYLAKSDVNVIVLDWSEVANANYASATAGVSAVGRSLGDFLIYLTDVAGARLDLIHLVGFSLGAHLVGNAGRQTGGKVARVTGLDPAGPLWWYLSERLGPADGVYVEAIHTDGGHTIGGLGIGRAIAQVDFFPNGGVSQPGCWLNSCNHKRAWELFAASVSYNHLVGRECSNGLQISWNRCSGKELHMGNDDLRKSGSGRYRVNTDRRYPF